MGQNGAGKSSIFFLITCELTPRSGQIPIDRSMTIVTARQVMNCEDLSLPITKYFVKAFDDVPRDIDKRIGKVMEP